MDTQTGMNIEEMEVFDQADLINRLGNDQELIATIVNIFIDDTPGLINELRKAIDDHDPESATRISHSIKGAAANVGGTRFSARAFELEKLGGDGALKEIAQKIPEFENEYLMLEDQLSKLLH